ncbi:GntR family transcriptional regulator [Cryptosporangium arvum]|uniref:GntR family transcriptional regulator n=1 Tax=Cryptosporangium arvum TaxID=80871 RepID=UPI0004BC366E|nr:GntR family transcriptional regulator [Cryptosporangium arvum]
MIERLTVDTTDPVPPYEQIRRQLADLIRHGVLGPGTRLPPVRQLASDLGLATGTVARAYRELETAGLVASRRGGGTRVAEAPVSSTPAERDELLAISAAGYVAAARRLGADDDALLAAVRRAARSGPG